MVLKHDVNLLDLPDLHCTSCGRLVCLPGIFEFRDEDGSYRYLCDRCFDKAVTAREQRKEEMQQ